MSADKEFSFSDVSEHATKKDLFIVVHDKVYDCGSFVDEHPGGEEVLLDVGGQDATEAFEDVGHSDEAREILEGLLVGKLKRGENDPPAKSSTPAKPSPSSASSGDAAGFGVTAYLLIIAVAGAAYMAYSFLDGSNKQKA